MGKKKKPDGRSKTSLTPRQATLVKNLKKGSTTVGNAATLAGYSPKNARQSGHQALKQIQKKMPQVMDDAGLSDKVLIDKYLRPGLEAKETEFAKFEGRITDQVDVIAWGPRLTALDMAFKLKGAYAPRDGEDALRTSPTVIILDMPRPPRNVTPGIPVEPKE